MTILLGVLGGLAALMGVLLMILAILASPLLLLVLIIRAILPRAGGNPWRVPVLLVCLIAAGGIWLAVQAVHHGRFAVHYAWPGGVSSPPSPPGMST